MIETLLGLPRPVITGLLLASLIVTLVVAFKVMEMIFETVTIAALSGAFYLGLTYFISGVSFAFNDLLLFSVLGASVYMLYSFLATIISTTSSIVKIPLAVLGAFYRPSKKILGKIYRFFKHKIRDYREEEISEPGNKTTKEVILNND